MYQSHEFYLRRAIEISKEAREAGNTPFGALLVNKEGEIIMEQGNIEITEKICTGHAEATLAARASHEYSREFLWDCTLYTAPRAYQHKATFLLTMAKNDLPFPVFLQFPSI